MQAVCPRKRERRYGYVNALFTLSTGSRRVPYSRPCLTPLCEERYSYIHGYEFSANFSGQYTFRYCSCFFQCRVSRLCHNSVNLPVCPGRSRTRHSNHDDCLAAVHVDSTSHTAMLFSLPTPDMKYTVAGLTMWHCF